MEEGFRLGELAERVGGRVHGDPGRRIRDIATLEQAGPSDLAFLANPKYHRAAEATRAGAVLAPPGTRLGERDILEVPEPYVALAVLLDLYHPPAPRRAGISSDARIGENARLGAGVFVGAYAVVGDRVALGDRCEVGPGCVVGDDCSLGDDTVIRPRVVLYPGTKVGARCIVHSGAVLGADGFGFVTTPEGHRKIPQVGRVVVEDDVEIGANTTVDRASLGETVIGRGSKLDNLVMIAHGVRVGPDALFAAQVGIAGSTRIGARVTFAGQVGVGGHLTIGERAVATGKAGVIGNLPEGAFVTGFPAVEHRRWQKIQALLRRLPELREEVRSLRARLEKLESAREREG